MERKWVHLLFASLWMGLIFLFVKMGNFFLASYFPGAYRELLIYGISAVVSLIATISVWSSKRFRYFVLECFTELEKVSWPTAKDTVSAAFVVIGVVVVVSVFLGLFDRVWEGLLGLIY